MGKDNTSISDNSYSLIPRKRMRYSSKNDDESSDDIDSEEETNEETSVTDVQSNDGVECSESSYKNKSRRFLNYVLGSFYHMYIISEPLVVSSADDNDRTQSNSKYHIEYIGMVKSAYTEYRECYSDVDKNVMVMSVNKYKFMISEKLINNLDIHKPIMQDSERNKHMENRDVSFNEIEDEDFMNELITYFKLDELIIETEIIINYKTLRRDKVLSVHKKISEIIENGTIFKLPINLPRKETDMVKKNITSNVCQYVTDIKEKSRFMKFKRLKEPMYKHNEDKYKNYLRTIKECLPREGFKNEFTYKYGSVARLFYNKSDANILRTVKKKKGSIDLLKKFLENNKDNHTDAIILVDLETNERITVIKRKIEFLWVNSISSNTLVEVKDLINLFKYGKHHVYKINLLPRKNLNNIHNNMIYIISKYTSKKIRLDDIKEIANLCSTNYEMINFNAVPILPAPALLPNDSQLKIHDQRQKIDKSIVNDNNR